MMLEIINFIFLIVEDYHLRKGNVIKLIGFYVVVPTFEVLSFTVVLEPVLFLLSI